MLTEDTNSTLNEPTIGLAAAGQSCTEYCNDLRYACLDVDMVRVFFYLRSVCESIFQRKKMTIF
jgi:hypothetical protein